MGGIDRRVDLKHALHSLGPHGRDPSSSHSYLPQTERKSDSKYFLIQPDCPRMTERSFGKTYRFCFEKGQIMFGIGADHNRRSSNFAGSHDDHPTGVRDHMIRSEHIAVGMDDDPGS